jgi:hypothetical protein
MGEDGAGFDDKDITPTTITWPERSKNWYYAHGGTLNPERRVSASLARKFRKWPEDYKRPYKQLAKGDSSPTEKRTS